MTARSLNGMEMCMDTAMPMSMFCCALKGLLLSRPGCSGCSRD